MANYNSRKKDLNPMYGKHHSEQSKNKIRQKLKARWETCNSTMKPTLNSMIQQYVDEITTPRLDSLQNQLEEYKVTTNAFIEIFKNSLQNEHGDSAAVMVGNNVMTQDELAKEVASSLKNEIGGKGRIIEVNGKLMFVKMLDSDERE